MEATTRTTRHMVLGLATVWTLAVTKPLFDVVGEAPEYWAANRIDSTTIVLFSLALAVLPPAFLGGLVAVLRRASALRVVGSAVFGMAFGALLSLALFHNASLVLGKSGLLAAASCAVSCLVTWAYWRSGPVRLFFSLFSVVLLIVPASFLFFGPTRNVLRRAEAPAGPLVQVKAPVVVVVFDELSLASLVDSNGDIDARLFPNFSRLEKTSTWYRNATTNYGETEHAVPSLLTGRFETSESAGTSFEQSPNSLFGLVGAPDGVFDAEPVTWLCPPEKCGDRSKSLADTFPRVAADLWLVYQYIMAPPRYASRLRPIPQRFHDLGLAEPIADPADTTRRFDDWLREGRRKSLAFLHFELPHMPYVRNPDGTVYMKVISYRMIGSVLAPFTWKLEPRFYVAQAYQRYLLQTMYADKLLGEILDRLDESGVSREATVVVTADHGVGFTPGEQRRSATLTLGAQNNAVPLFWKSSGQVDARISSRNVELVDILPTLLDELGAGGASVPMDGQSMRSPNERTEKVFGGRRYASNVWPDVLEASRALREQIAVTKNGDGSFFVLPSKYASLVGREIADAKPTTATAAIDSYLTLDELAHVDFGSASRPNFVEGSLGASDDATEAVAVVVNGRIADVADVFVDESGRRRFASVFNPSFLETGANTVEFCAVRMGPSGGVELALMRTPQEGFRVEGGILVNSAGVALARDQRRLMGAFDSIEPTLAGTLHLVGWVGDRKTGEAARAYLVLYRGEQVLFSRPSGPRPDLAYISASLAQGGFDALIDLEGKPFVPADLRVLVIFDEGTYAEMSNEIGVVQGGE